MKFISQTVSKTTLILLFSIILIGAVQPALAATEFYVATNGSDSNSGSIDAPVRTIQQAVNRVTNGGTIYVRGGSYQVSGEITINSDHDGTSSSWLVIRPYGNEAVKLVSPASAPAFSVSGQYVEINGFECTGGSHGIIGVRAQHLRILNNTVHDVQQHGIAAYGIERFNTSDILIRGNTVYRAALANQNRNQNGWASGLTISNGANAEVSGNRVYNNYGEGFTDTLSDNVRVFDNVLYDNYSCELYMDNATRSVFERNFAYTTGNQAFYRQLNGRFQPAVGICFNNENYGNLSNPNNNNTVRNNIVIGGLAGMAFTNSMSNTEIVNNTFYGGAIGATDYLVLAFNRNYNNVRIANNIFYQTVGNRLIYFESQPLGGITFDHNLWFGGDPQSAAGVGDVRANPNFVNASGYDPNGFKLQSGSPAIDAGAALGSVTSDYFGAARPQGAAYDIGAAENGSGGPQPPNGGIAAGQVYILRNQCSDKVLDVSGASLSDTAPFILWSSNNGLNQRFKLGDAGGNNIYTLLAQHSQKAVDVQSSGTTDGTLVWQYAPNGTNAQRWQIVDVGNGFYKLLPQSSPGKALDVSGSSTADGARIQIWTDNNSCAQKWRFEAVN